MFSDTFSTTALALCQSFASVDELAYMDLAQRSSFLQEIGKNRFPHPEEAAKSDKHQISQFGKCKRPPLLHLLFQRTFAFSFNVFPADRKNEVAF